MQNKKVALIAPAGSFESLTAAIQNGADGIYFGVEQLNMRARAANNFTLEDIEKIVRTCTQNKVDSYLTLNTILYNHDITLMKSILHKAKEAGVSAVIASDPAVIEYGKKTGINIHLSTQANVSNIEAVKFYAHYADVIVLARELTLSQVKFIVREIERKQIKGPSGLPVKIEIFAHGALCMAVSGKCYLSLHSHFASANRGACIQNCRKNYIVIDKEDGIEYEIENDYIMSAKDLCTIDFLPQIMETGVSVLKIEGRGRSADYVAVTTKCYREAIDTYYEGTFTPDKVYQWKERLSTVFNRGFWEGYYLGRLLGEWTDTNGSKATKRKVYVGKGIKYFDKIGVGEFKGEAHFIEQGDEVIITGPTTGVLQFFVEELQVNNLKVVKAKKGETFSMPVNSAIRPSDKLYKLVDM